MQKDSTTKGYDVMDTKRLRELSAKWRNCCLPNHDPVEVHDTFCACADELEAAGLAELLEEREKLIGALELARLRLGILAGRFRGCDGMGHEVSLGEIPAWQKDIADALAALGEGRQVG